MSADDFLARVITALECAGVPYMLTGSYASAAYGTPRSTNDVDIVIAPSPDELRRLLREFPDDRYYADEEDVPVSRGAVAVQCDRLRYLVEGRSHFPQGS